VPWHDWAVPEAELVTALVAVVEDVTGIKLPDYQEALDHPGRSAHGRLSWIIHLSGGAYIDLALMPRRAGN